MSDDVTAVTTHSPQEGQPYRVRLEVFEGPLDLLLHLIEKQELDITRVSLAVVTDQYLDYLSHLEQIHAEILADFLVVAAKLLLIKSRALLPASPQAEEECEDVGDDLVRQLREYKKYKDLAKQLREREESGLRAYLRVAFPPRPEKKLDLTDVTLEDLLAAVREALVVQPPVPPVDEVVSPITFTIGEQMQAIESWLTRNGSFSFQHMLRKATSRAEVIITFLAVLELMKAGRVRVQQEKLFGEIMVLRAEEPSETLLAQQPPQQ